MDVTPLLALWSKEDSRESVSDPPSLSFEPGDRSPLRPLTEAAEKKGLLSSASGDPNDLREQRWGVVAPEGPEGERLLELISDLRGLRSEQQGEEAVVYRVKARMSTVEAEAFVDGEYWDKVERRTERLPRYLLVLGDAGGVSWQLQQTLARHGVLPGRLAAPTDEGYRAYAAKVRRWDGAASGERDALFYAVNDPSPAVVGARAGILVPTRESVKDSSERGRYGAPIRLTSVGIERSGRPEEDLEATLGLAREARGGILVSVSHGLGVREEDAARDPALRQSRQGALVVARGHELLAERVASGSFLPGGAWLFFACFGAGTPADSAYAGWLRRIGRDDRAAAALSCLSGPGHEPFVAALPRAALANPDGPLAVVGHVDLAWSWSYLPRREPSNDGYAPRPERLAALVHAWLRGDRFGPAHHALSSHAVEIGSSLLSRYAEPGEGGQGEDWQSRMSYSWLEYQDLNNYVLLGDPAAALPGSRLFERREARSAAPAPSISTPARPAVAEVHPSTHPPAFAAAPREDAALEPEDVGEPFEIVIELSRARDGGEPFAFQAETQTYHRREEGGSIQEAELAWDGPLLSDLESVQRGARDVQAEARLGARVGKFLRKTLWPEGELARALAAKRPVRITLRSAAAELYSLPWELLSLGASGARLARQPDCLIRYEWPGTHTTPLTAQAEGGRILFAWSAAGGRVPSELHRNAIASACEGRLAFDPGVDELGGSALSCEGLAAKLEEARASRKPYTVLHILCHGAPVSSDPPTCALIWGEELEREIVDGQTLGELLAEHAGALRLVVLSACQGGDADGPGSALGGVAQSLHRAGLEAVVASRFPLSIEGSIDFTEAFYEHLLGAPSSVERSFLAARRELATRPGLTDDTSLQLYARREDGLDTRPILVRPYRGLTPFREEDRRFFFGREAEIDEVTSDLNALVDRALPRLLVVAGASGTGKSSMVFAGVAPKLRTDGWDILSPIRPGAEPLGELARARAELEARLSRGERRCVLVVDQLEELFTLSDVGNPGRDARRDAFVQELWALASSPEPVVAVLATMRVDFIGRAGEILLDPASGLRFDKGVVYRDEHRTLVAQMASAQLREAIERPARRVGLSMEPGLVDRLVADVGREPGALPLVQFTMDCLWERRRGRKLTQAVYDELGGIAGALARSADGVLHELDEEAKEVAMRLFVRLVSIRDDATLDTRRRVDVDDVRPQGERGAAFDAVLRRFTEARLLVCGEGGGRATIEVAHEALIRSWSTLRGWIKEQRRMLSDFEVLMAWAAEKEQDPRFLLMGSQLERARGMMSGYAGEIALDPSLAGARALVVESEAEVRRRDDEREAQTRRELAQARRARELALVVGARELFTGGKPEWATKVLAESQEPGLARGWAQLACELLGTSWTPYAILRGHEGPATSVAVSPDGARILSASADGTARVWSADGTGEPRILGGHPAGLTSASWSADGARIVTACVDGSLRLWDASGAPPPVLLRGHGSGAFSARLDPAGQRLAVGCGDGAVRVWSAEGAGEPLVLEGHEGQVLAVEWSPDGQRLMSAGSDGHVRVRSVDGSGAPLVLGEGLPFTCVAWSPDGSCIAAGTASGASGVVHRWTSEGTSIDPPFGPEAISCIAWSPDGSRIATGASSGAVSVFSCEGWGGANLDLGSHGAEVRAVAFTADGQHVLSAGADGVAMLWTVGARSLAEKLRAACALCLPPELRVAYLGESEEEARAAYEACERSHGRAPPPPLGR